MDTLQTVVSSEFSIKERSVFDRRNSEIQYDFPMKMHDGSKVYNDRRTKPERRIQNINVSEIVIQESAFTNIFKKYQ